MVDKLIISDLAVPCRIGVTEAERATPQTIWVDLELAIDAAKAARYDRLTDAVDYARLARRIEERAQQPVQLLETIADAIADLVLFEFRSKRVTVKVKKRALPNIGYAAVEVTRSA